MAGHLALIVKATRHCNLRCSYCHDWRSGRDQRLDFETMAHMMASALRDSGRSSVEFIWHGGEPTILPFSFYEKALYVQAAFRQDGQRVTNSLQTNGTRITAQWARFFARNGFSVSVSLDGPPNLHDRTRTYASGRASSDDVLRGIRTLKAHEVPFGVLMVVDHEALALGAEAIFEFFVENGIHDFGLLPVAPVNRPNATPGTPTEHYVDPGQATAFFCELFDIWQAHGDHRIKIRELEAIRARILGRAPGVCTFAGDCFGRYYAIEPNGDIAHCDKFVGDASYTLGNVHQIGFAELESNPQLVQLRRLNDGALAEMRGCPEFGVCNGWCPHDRYLSIRHDPGHRDDCCGLQGLIAHVRTRVTEPPAAVQEQLR